LANVTNRAGGVRWCRSRQPRAGRTEVVAVLVVVAFEPAGAEAEDEAAAADVVDGPGHVREQVGIAVADRGDQGGQLHPAGRLGRRRQRGPAFEMLAVRLAEQREEVVPDDDQVRARKISRPDYPGNPSSGACSSLSRSRSTSSLMASLVIARLTA
jgi:hypothetical protein